MMAYRP
jgi:hypothetical protein